MITISAKDYENLVAHAKSELPNEACGLIAGTITENNKEIQKVYLLTNIDKSNEHFSLDPKEQLASIKDMRANGLSPLGNWHSHPETPSRPFFDSSSNSSRRFSTSSSGLISFSN